MIKHRYIYLTICTIFISFYANTSSFNSLGQTGLINLPSAESKEEQSIYFTFTRNSYKKLGTITVSPFDWLEASYFYYRPDDLLWGGAKGLYLDKGFNVKFSYKPKSIFLPKFAVGLDDFAGTGQFTKEYIATTYSFNNLKFTSGIGWGKFVGKNSINNPMTVFKESFEKRLSQSDNYSSGGNLSYDLWFRGDSALFAGLEIKVPYINNLNFKIETDPFDYFKFGCCGEGLSNDSFEERRDESNYNIGLSYSYKNFGNIDFSYINGNTFNLSLSFGFSSSKSLRKKNKFQPNIKNTEYQLDKKNEFYLDVLENLNANKLFLQTANFSDDEIEITIDSEEHFNPIIYASRSAYITNEIAKLNGIEPKKISVGHITRGSQLNSITFRSSDLNLKTRYPNILVKRNTLVKDIDPKKYENHEFKPRVNFPIFINNISPDIRTHIGSPERFLYSGIGIKLDTEIQFNREYVFYSSVGRNLEDNFDEKISRPSSQLELVRTEIVDYLQQSSDDFYVANMQVERIWSPIKNIYSKLSFGLLEPMYGGLASEVLYKPFNSNFAFGIEINKIKKRNYDQKFEFLDYKTSTRHFNIAYYEPRTNILAKWSYGKYLAKDSGYTLDLSRRMPSGWRAGFFFSRTNVSAEEFGEGSFDKGFYFNFPLNIFSKDYSKEVNGFKFRTMTRDGGQKLELNNRLIDSFYGSSRAEIEENWLNYLN